jgi:glyoxylase-like metal-dependent hydrolase (beta-lactamase superfamily II)
VSKYPADTTESQSEASVAKAGTYRILLPVPYDQHGVNCWLIEDDPLTLVDVGVNSASAMIELERKLAERNLKIEDLERIVVTHQHPDHCGLLGVLASRSGAEVVAIAPLADWLGDYDEQRSLDDQYRLDLLSQHGLPESIRTVLTTTNGYESHWGAGAEITRTVSDGGVLEFARRSWVVLERPGHSATDTVFHDPERKMLFTGDHLMPKVASNPYLTRPLNSYHSPNELLPRALATYLESIELTRQMDLNVLLPGHGQIFDDHRAVILHHERTMRTRMSRVQDLLGSHPATAFEINCRLEEKNGLRLVEVTMSNTLGLLMLLCESGQVSMDADRSPVRFHV